MSEKIVVDLGNVQKTLFLPLWGRAFETAKRQPAARDREKFIFQGERPVA